MFVIFDTNIWIKELGINTIKGQATKVYLHQKSATIALPEVVKLETEIHLAKELKNYTYEIEKNYRRLLTVFGKLKEIVLPDERMISAKVNAIFEQFGLEVKHIPFSLESAKKSFLKTIHKIPPSGTNQQFKDGVIWEDALSLLQKDEVYLVSGDKAFYKDKNTQKGLAPELSAELENYQNKLHLYPSINDLIKEIRTDVSIDEKKLSEGFYQKNKEEIDNILCEKGFSIDSIGEISTNCFITELNLILLVEFEASYNLVNISSEIRHKCTMTVKGEANYKMDEEKFYNFKKNEIKITSTNAEDKEICHLTCSYSSFAIDMGHATRCLGTKEPLSQFHY